MQQCSPDGTVKGRYTHWCDYHPICAIRWWYHLHQRVPSRSRQYTADRVKLKDSRFERTAAFRDWGYKYNQTGTEGAPASSPCRVQQSYREHFLLCVGYGLSSICRIFFLGMEDGQAENRRCLRRGRRESVICSSRNLIRGPNS